LIVEDNDAVRALIRKILQQHGYTVLVARHSEEAFELSGRREGSIHAMITDVVMPGMSGREVAERLKSSRPTMKVLFLSGYTNEGVLDTGAAFLQKPFTPDVLLHKVREVLDASV